MVIFYKWNDSSINLYYYINNYKISNQYLLLIRKILQPLIQSKPFKTIVKKKLSFEQFYNKLFKTFKVLTEHTG